MANPTQQTLSVDSFQQQQSEEENSPLITHQGTEEDLSALRDSLITDITHNKLTKRL
jgi:hypothetical protein